MTLYGVELVVRRRFRQAASSRRRLAAAARQGGHDRPHRRHRPGHAYELAAEREPDWSAASLWWGDERCVPPDDERSNFRLARENLLDRLEAQPRCTGSAASSAPTEAADEYDELLRRRGSTSSCSASAPTGTRVALPEQPTLEERERRAIPAEAKLEPFVDRVTMTLPVLASAARSSSSSRAPTRRTPSSGRSGRPPTAGAPAAWPYRGPRRVAADRAAAAKLLDWPRQDHSASSLQVRDSSPSRVHPLRAARAAPKSTDDPRAGEPLGVDPGHLHFHVRAREPHRLAGRRQGREKPVSRRGSDRESRTAPCVGRAPAASLLDSRHRSARAMPSRFSAAPASPGRGAFRPSRPSADPEPERALG